jgi:hypothetical protein
MKKQLSLLLPCFLLLFTECGQENKTSKTGTENSADTFVVNEEYDDDAEEDENSFSDSTYSLQIKGNVYLLLLSHEDVPFHQAGESTTVRIVEQSTHTLYEKTFDFNSVGQLRHPAPDHYWLSLLNSGGGSGYSATLFNIKLEPEIVLQPIFNFNELSDWKTNRDATEIIFFQAIWNIDWNHEGEETEAHFQEHLQHISLYTIREDTVIAKEIGMTKAKYDLNASDTAMLEIKRKEAGLFKSIDWENYNLTGIN